MRKLIPIAVAIILLASCIPWVRTQRMFSIAVGVAVVVLGFLMVFSAVSKVSDQVSDWAERPPRVASLLTVEYWVERRSKVASSFTAQRISKYVIFAFVFALLLLGLPHFLATGNGAYKLAVATARQNDHFNETLGTPIKEGWSSQYSYELGEGGRANFSIPVQGKLRKGTLSAAAIKVHQRWELTQLKLEVEGNSESIDLLSK